MKKNPAAKKFFEVFTISLADVSAQNTKMSEGEKSQKDVKRHAAEWIAQNQVQWNKWLEQARDAAK